MAQVDTFEAFNQRNTEFLERYVLTPIVDYVNHKGCHVTLDDFRSVLKLSKVTVAPFDVAPSIGGLPSSVGVPRIAQPKKTPTARTTTGERCAHILKKSKDRSGDACGKAAFMWSRCKGCLAKKSVQEELSQAGIASTQDILAAINDPKKKDGTTVVAPPTASLAQGTMPTAAMPMGAPQNDFIEVDHANKIILHNPSRLLLQPVADGVYNTVGILPADSNNAEPITEDKRPLIAKYGFLYEGKPVIIAPAPAPVSMSVPAFIQSPLVHPPAPSPMILPQQVYAPTANGTMVMPPPIPPPSFPSMQPAALIPPPTIPGLVQPVALGTN
jgi:hypothetical protein